MRKTLALLLCLMCSTTFAADGVYWSPTVLATANTSEKES